MEDLTGASVLVTGAGITGRAILAALTPLGVRATLTDDSPTALTSYAQKGVAVIDPAHAVERISDFALVVTSPGFPPTAPVLAAAAAAGVPIWGDVELAWRLDRSGRFGPPRKWLVVTGTNGKTTTTSMLFAMLEAAGLRAVLCGNIGDPVLDLLDRPADVLAVELSSFQLHWAPSLRPEAGVVLNVAEDHLDWHGSMASLRAGEGAGADGPGGRRRPRRPGGRPPARGVRGPGPGRFPVGRAGAGRGRGPRRGARRQRVRSRVGPRRDGQHPGGGAGRCPRCAGRGQPGPRRRRSGGGNRRGAGDLPGRQAPRGGRRGLRRNHLRRRFQGNQSARRPGLDQRLFPGWSGWQAGCSRAPLSTRWSRRSQTDWSGRC